MVRETSPPLWPWPEAGSAALPCSAARAFASPASKVEAMRAAAIARFMDQGPSPAMVAGRLPAEFVSVTEAAEIERNAEAGGDLDARPVSHIALNDIADQARIHPGSARRFQNRAARFRRGGEQHLIIVPACRQFGE